MYICIYIYIYTYICPYSYMHVMYRERSMRISHRSRTIPMTTDTANESMRGDHVRAGDTEARRIQ